MAYMLGIENKTMSTIKSSRTDTAKAFAVLIPAGLGMIELFGWAHQSGGAFQAAILNRWPDALALFKNPFIGIYLLLPMLMTGHASRLIGEWVLFRLPSLGDRSFQETHRPWIIALSFAALCGLLYKLITLVLAGQFLDPEVSAEYLIGFFALSGSLRLFLLNLPNNFEFPAANGAFAFLGKEHRGIYCIANYIVIEWDVMDGEVTLIISKSDFPELTLRPGNGLQIRRVNRYLKRRNTVALAFKVGEVASTLNFDSFGDGLLKLKSIHAQVNISKTLAEIDLAELPVASLRDSSSSALAGTKVEQFLEGILKRAILDALAEVEASESCEIYQDALNRALSGTTNSHPMELVQSLNGVTDAGRRLQSQSTQLARALSRRKQTHGGLFVISFTPAGIVPNPDCALSEPAYARLMSSIQIALGRDQFDQELRIKLLDGLRGLANSEIYPTNVRGKIDDLIQDVQGGIAPSRGNLNSSGQSTSGGVEGEEPKELPGKQSQVLSEGSISQVPHSLTGTEQPTEL
jgi:hypothetical protein